MAWLRPKSNVRSRFRLAMGAEELRGNWEETRGSRRGQEEAGGGRSEAGGPARSGGRRQAWEETGETGTAEMESGGRHWGGRAQGLPAVEGGGGGYRRRAGPEHTPL